MRLRSLLFVPADRPDRFDKAAATGADALILDLEDSVSFEHKDVARAAVAARLAETRVGPHIFVRTNPLGSGLCEADLAALAGLRPAGLLLPKAEGAASVRSYAALLANAGLADVPIFPIATETPAAIFQLGSYGEVSKQLIALTWGAEDLPAAIGAHSSREDDGSFTPPYEIVRSLALFAAHAASVAAIETVFPAIRDLDGLAAYATRAVRDGFSGMMAIHPDQVAIINQAFTPGAEAIVQARLIIAAFAENPGIGALQIGGKMIDAPHLKQARAIITQVGG